MTRSMTVMLELLDPLGQPDNSHVVAELHAIEPWSGTYGSRWQLAETASWPHQRGPVRAVAITELPRGRADASRRSWTMPLYNGDTPITITPGSRGWFELRRLYDGTQPGIPGDPRDMAAPNPFADTDDDGTLTVERQREQLWGSVRYTAPDTLGGSFRAELVPPATTTVTGELQPPLTLRTFGPGTVTWDGRTLAIEYDQHDPPAITDDGPATHVDEHNARRLLARHLRVLASAVNVADWPAYIRLCADGHDAGTAWLDTRMVEPTDEDRPLVAHQERAHGRWRVGRHFPEHVYAGDTPVATFVGARAAAASNARQVVLDHNRMVPGIPDGEWVVIPPMGWANRVDELLSRYGIDMRTPMDPSNPDDGPRLGAALVQLVREWGVQG